MLGGADGCNVVDCGGVTINGAVPEQNVLYGVQRWWCVWPKYRALKEEDNEATVWFWLASWPIHHKFLCIFCGVADCYEGSFAFYLDWSSSLCGGKFGQYESMRL